MALELPLEKVGRCAIDGVNKESFNVGVLYLG